MASIQVAISFDTTGSMAKALAEVRKRISEMIRRLKTDIPGVNLSVIAHGDYCDKDIYVTKHLDFSDDDDRLVDFVNNVQDTGGGDFPECYELVLRLVRTKLTWKRKAQKILIVIGDSYPHPPTDPQNKDNIDWRQEARLLAEIGMRIYGVQINSNPQSTDFFRTITRMSGGCHLELSEFSTLSDVILAICYRSKGTDALKGLEREVRERYAPKPLHEDLEAVFTVLHQPHAVPTVPAKHKESPQLYKGKHTAFFWGGQITPSHPLTWEEPEDEHRVHRLKVTLAVLNPTAEQVEVNVVEVETTDINGQRVKQPLVKMVGGRDSTISVGVSFNSKVTFSLARGSGPVYLSGQHVAEALSEDQSEDKDETEACLEASGGDESIQSKLW
ncbi:uncharacterized protein [Littorina saxatilis]|uniref:VWFA domain-containing protein n=1 Tax=Littorina saxatilis TaxID=31220 RepID=A0AAN9GLL9_9CAEN